MGGKARCGELNSRTSNWLDGGVCVGRVQVGGCELGRQCIPKYLLSLEDSFACSCISSDTLNVWLQDWHE